MVKIYITKQQEDQQEMYTGRNIFIYLILCLLIFSCRDKGLERNIMDCLKTADYAFIIQNSILDVSESFAYAQSQNYKAFNPDTRFKVLRHKKLYNDHYELLMVSSNEKMIYIQYIKQSDNSVLIFYLDIEERKDFEIIEEIE